MAEKSSRPKSAHGNIRNWRRRFVWFAVLSPVVYLLLTGPALWSRSFTRNENWRKGVIYFVAPVMWIDHQFRDKTLVEEVGLIDLRRAPNTKWYRWLTGYWGMFGQPTLAEADHIAMLLKFKFHE